MGVDVEARLLWYRYVSEVHHCDKRKQLIETIIRDTSDQVDNDAVDA
jgi:hypothetical protein